MLRRLYPSYTYTSMSAEHSCVERESATWRAREMWMDFLFNSKPTQSTRSHSLDRHTSKNAPRLSHSQARVDDVIEFSFFLNLADLNCIKLCEYLAHTLCARYVCGVWARADETCSTTLFEFFSDRRPHWQGIKCCTRFGLCEIKTNAQRDTHSSYEDELATASSDSRVTRYILLLGGHGQALFGGIPSNCRRRRRVRFDISPCIQPNILM